MNRVGANDRSAIEPALDTTEVGRRRPTLGVVAISYNEEVDLPAFLEHLIPWVDEIVIVDDGSTDQTLALIRAAGPSVVLVESPRGPGEFYADQRNKGIDAASSDWLLHMDIDERVTPELAQEILAAISQPGRDAYRFRRLNYFLHRPMKGGGWADWNLVHLARREVLRFQGMFHETCAVNAPEERIGQLRHSMVHLNDESFEERMRKSANYLPEVVERLRQSGKRVTGTRIVSAALRTFVSRYLYKQGFRDGTLGLISALHSTTATFRAYAVAWDEQNRISREDVEEQLRASWRQGSALGKR